MAILRPAQALRITAVMLAVVAVAFQQFGETGREQGDTRVGVPSTGNSLQNQWAITGPRTTDSNKNHVGNLCSQFTNNPCGCALQACAFDVNKGYCVPIKKVCTSNDFWPGACQRKGAFYSVSGRICQNLEQTGECEREVLSKSNFAVNMNGFTYIDANKIHYRAQNDTNVKPEISVLYRNSTECHVSICKKAGKGDMAEIKNHRENDLIDADIRNLLWTYVEGNAMRYQSNPGEVKDSGCLGFPITFEDDGVFELIIKATEMEYPHTKTRFFDIKMNEVILFSNVDLVGLAEEQCSAIDLIINFVVRRNRTEISFSGFKNSRLEENGKTILQFCNSKCSRYSIPIWDNNFIINTFAITKLKKGGSTNA